MRVIAVLSLLLLLLAAGPARAGDPTIMVFHSTLAGADEDRLVEALRIYTRDLPCRIVIGSMAPLSLDRPAIDVIAQQAAKEGATIALWVGRRRDGRRVYDVLSLADLDVRETELGQRGPQHAAQEVALKVRTLLTRRPVLPEAPETAEARPETRDVTPRRAGEPAANRQPAVAEPREGESGAEKTQPPGPEAHVLARASAANPAATKRVTPEGQPTAPGSDSGADPAELIAVGPSPAAAGAGGLDLGAAYGVAAPLRAGWFRHGLTLTARIRLRDHPYALSADGTIAPAVDTSARGFNTAFRDVPLGVSVQREWVTRRVGVAVGPRLGLHVFDATTQSSGDGRAGSSRLVSASIGAAGRLAVPVTGWFRIVLGLTLEALLPARNFTVSGQSAIDTGPVLIEAGAGISLAIP
ncbi:MAG: hypothetical protein ABUL67_01440 [Haliangium ochraceum]